MKDERTGGEDKPIRWGIIGCGNVVETKNGVPTYTADHSELAGVWNRTAERRRRGSMRKAMAKCTRPWKSFWPIL